MTIGNSSNDYRQYENLSLRTLFSLFLTNGFINNNPMPIRYRPVKKKNPAKPGEPELYFPCPVSVDKVNARQLANEIAVRTSLSTTDTVAVLEAFTKVIPFFLGEGAIVSLGDFGSFRIAMTGKGTATKKAMTSANVTGIRVIFRPGPEFTALIETAELEKEK
jgi:predicted histone-like DNA-binding protein